MQFLDDSPSPYFSLFFFFLCVSENQKDGQNSKQDERGDSMEWNMDGDTASRGLLNLLDVG